MYFEPLLRSGVRLVCPARPGYGDSAPYAMKDIGEWARIVAALAGQLSLGQFDVLAISSGSPYGYSIAHGLHDHIGNLFVFSGIPALYDTAVRSAWPHPMENDATLDSMRQLSRATFFDGLSTRAPRQPDIRDSMMNNCFGPALDLLLRSRDWGFQLSEIVAPVHMRHSRTDPEVPIETAERTAHLLPYCTLETDDGPHFSSASLHRFIHDTILPCYSHP